MNSSDFIEAVNMWKTTEHFESWLVQFYVATTQNYHRVGTRAFRTAFELADREKLRNADGCDAIPDGESFTLYRGVAGPSRFRRVRGLSWIWRLEDACWFALRYKLADPAVYVAAVPRQDVLFCQSAMDALEFVVWPPRSVSRLVLSKNKMRELASNSWYAECEALVVALKERDKQR